MFRVLVRQGDNMFCHCYLCSYTGHIGLHIHSSWCSRDLHYCNENAATLQACHFEVGCSSIYICVKCRPKPTGNWTTTVGYLYNIMLPLNFTYSHLLRINENDWRKWVCLIQFSWVWIKHAILSVSKHLISSSYLFTLSHILQ